MRLTTNIRYNNLTTVPKVSLRGIKGLVLLLATTSVLFAQQTHHILTQPDIVFTHSNPFALKLGLFDGQAFQIETHTSFYMNENNANRLSIADFDGDGFSEVFLQVTQNTLAIKSFTNSQKLFVKTIVNGLNHKTSFTYNPITNNTYYEPVEIPYTMFPMSTFQQPFYVVTQMSRQMGSFTDTETYHYKGTRLHKQGKGFLGFEEVKVTNANQNKVSTTKYGYNATYYTVYPTQQKITTASGSPISQTDFTNSHYVSLSPKVIFPYVSSQTTRDNLTGISKSVTYSYPSSYDGNPYVITETQGSLTTQTVYVWEAKNSTYKNRITQHNVTRSGIGTSFTEYEKFEYDAKARFRELIREDFSRKFHKLNDDYGEYSLQLNYKDPFLVHKQAFRGKVESNTVKVVYQK